LLLLLLFLLLLLLLLLLFAFAFALALPPLLLPFFPVAAVPVEAAAATFAPDA
jgi:hypothetical protein